MSVWRRAWQWWLRPQYAPWVVFTAAVITAALGELVT